MVTLFARAPALRPGAHRLYRTLVDALLTTGKFPPAPALAARLDLPEAGAQALLAELVAADWAGTDDSGALAALYPFSPAPTGVCVRVRGVERHAMCAIDALGVAPMLGEPVAIDATCTVCGAPLRLAVVPAGVDVCFPASVVALHRRAPGPAHQSRCAATRFACCPDHARAWLAERGGPDDVVLPLDGAFARGAMLFGEAYTRGRSGL